MNATNPLRLKNRLQTVAAALTLLAGASSAMAQGTAFTYQGRLLQSGSLVQGLFDLRFTLFDSSNSVTVVAGPNTNSAVTVSNGLFTVLIDFGAGIFTGAQRWLELAVRTNGSTGAFTVLSPRQNLTPVPYAIFSGGAATANGVANGSVSALQLSTPGAPVSGQVLVFNGSSLAWTSAPPTVSAWSLTGNAGTTPGVDFLGTTDFKPLELYANNSRGFELSYASRGSSFNHYDSMNVLGGLKVNTVSNGVVGATIAGGGYETDSFGLISHTPNVVTNDFGTVGGGAGNTAAYYATVPGGWNNQAYGSYSFVCGQGAVSTQPGSFVFADDQTGNQFTSLLPNEVAIRADNGMFMQTQRGIRLNAQNSPLITRGFDLFNGGTPGGKDFCGRWGLFMESGSLALGIPTAEIGYRRMEVARYRTDGTRDSIFTVGNDGVTTVEVLTITGGADVAEPFALADADIPKGSVVVIDEAHPGQLRLSTHPYDRHVAGIVSGANGVHPGLSLQQHGLNDGGQNVALSGRVYVLADAANGEILPGDLLTTAARPGHAMKVADRARAQGAVLGKAMSGLENGTGLVLVLVTLQ